MCSCHVMDYATDTEISSAAPAVQAVRLALQQVLFGKEELIDLTICGLLARGHILLEGRPGLGKTEWVKGLAKALPLETKRIQFTQDLLPVHFAKQTLENGKCDCSPGPP